MPDPDKSLQWTGAALARDASRRSGRSRRVDSREIVGPELIVIEMLRDVCVAGEQRVGIIGFFVQGGGGVDVPVMRNA